MHECDQIFSQHLEAALTADCADAGGELTESCTLSGTLGCCSSVSIETVYYVGHTADPVSLELACTEQGAQWRVCED